MLSRSRQKLDAIPLIQCPVLLGFLMREWELGMGATTQGLGLFRGCPRQWCPWSYVDALRGPRAGTRLSLQAAQAGTQ